jgi:guanylate kinase
VDEYSQYDYLVVNDDQGTAVEGLEAIVTAERARTQRMRPKAEAIIGTFE